ncbi:MAG TPA: hypothetical protein VM597_13060, partial [Gemmataceae bacterium]|nr:hypothetical protein [Gemmataceae bacterium]
LYWHEKLIHGLPSAVPYLLFATFIGYAIGRGRVRARAARLAPRTHEEADYGDSAVGPGNSRPEAVCPSPAGLRTPHQIVRREVIIGLMWGLGIAAVVTPFVLNYRCIRADGSYGPVPVTPVFATVGAGNAPAPRASRPLNPYEWAGYGFVEALPVVGIATGIGWVVGLTKLRAARRRGTVAIPG